MDLELRSPNDDELDGWFFAESSVFGGHPHDDDRAAELALQPRDRMISVFDRGRTVATAGSYPFSMTVPGGGSAAVAGVTAVGVLGTHRRRGILTAMMRHQLDDVAARGEVAAVLNASEAIIYPRFGYGLASLYQSVVVDPRRSGFVESVPEAGGELRLVPRQDAAGLLAQAWDRCLPQTPGEVGRSADWWDVVLGDRPGWKGGGEVFVVVHLDTDGRADGAAIYEVDSSSHITQWSLTVRELVAAEPGVRARLWRYLLDVDLMGEISFPACPVDDPLRWWLQDSRQVQVRRVSDYLWVRPLDVEAYLSTRCYGGHDPLVVEVRDHVRPGTEGAYRITPDGARPGRCERTDDEPDLVLGVDVLGGLSLGGVATAGQLARAGRVEQRRAGALAVADRLFASPIAPFCATRF